MHNRREQQRSESNNQLIHTAMKKLRNAFLRKTNILLATLIAALGIGCKTTQKAASTGAEENTATQVIVEPAKKYGPPRPIRIESNEEPTPLKYGVPPEVLEEKEKQQERIRVKYGVPNR